MRLIDANELTMQIMSMITDKAILYGNDAIKRSKEIFALAMVAQAPTIDAVPVIRCMDCKYSKPIDSDWLECLHDKRCMKENGFCSWAERRGEQ